MWKSPEGAEICDHGLKQVTKVIAPRIRLGRKCIVEISKTPFKQGPSLLTRFSGAGLEFIPENGDRFFKVTLFSLDNALEKAGFRYGESFYLALRRYRPERDEKIA